MKDIKQKFLDILFEPVEEDEPEQVKEVKKQEEVKPRVQKEESSVKAKDILYHKSEGSAFIDLNDLSKPAYKNEEKQENNYEFSSQISPIFGVLKENKRRPIKKDNDTNETIINKPEDSHLEIITSPIYGYGDQEDLDGNRNMTGGLLSDEQELHLLLDEEKQDISNEEYEENFEDYLDEQQEEEYIDEYFEEEEYPQENESEEDESIFMHQRYDFDEGEITLFDTIEDEE